MGVILLSPSSSKITVSLNAERFCLILAILPAVGGKYIEVKSNPISTTPKILIIIRTNPKNPVAKPNVAERISSCFPTLFNISTILFLCSIILLVTSGGRQNSSIGTLANTSSYT